MDEDLPVLRQAPPLDPSWLAYEIEADLLSPKPIIDPIERQPLYADQCRQRNAAMMAPGARDHYLSQGIRTQFISVPSSKDGFHIPVLQYDRIPDSDSASDSADETSVMEPECVLVYYHGGGLLVGEADAEDLSCRRLVKDSASFLPRLRLYSIGYRLLPQNLVPTCASDSIDAFTVLAGLHPSARIIAVGSSSGGQLAALVAQHAARGVLPIHGVLLRCPVTSDAAFHTGSGSAHIPPGLQDMHTSARDPSFGTSLLFRLYADPRDGLDRMPLEASVDDLREMPRTWVQLCTNDALYSDGACYVKALRNAGVEVRADVVWGWPHTFWLKAPALERALEADSAMIEGLAWVSAVKK